MSERFIAGSPPSLLWSAPNSIPSSVSWQIVQGVVTEPSPFQGQKQSTLLSSWSENPLTHHAGFGDKKGSFTAEKLPERSAVQTVQPVWDLLEIVVQRDDFSSENVSNGPRPEPSAARVGAEADPPRDISVPCLVSTLSGFEPTPPGTATFFAHQRRPNG